MEVEEHRHAVAERAVDNLAGNVGEDMGVATAGVRSELEQVKDTEEGNVLAGDAVANRYYWQIERSEKAWRSIVVAKGDVEERRMRY